MTIAKNPAHSARAIACPREWFRNLLWQAFPAQSDSARAKAASRALGVSIRQVQHWLRLEHDAALRYVFAVLVIAGAEAAFRQIGGRQ